MNTEKMFDAVETPGGIVKLPYPMTDDQYYTWVKEHNAKLAKKNRRKSTKGVRS